MPTIPLLRLILFIFRFITLTPLFGYSPGTSFAALFLSPPKKKYLLHFFLTHQNNYYISISMK